MSEKPKLDPAAEQIARQSDALMDAFRKAHGFRDNASLPNVKKRMRKILGIPDEVKTKKKRGRGKHHNKPKS